MFWLGTKYAHEKNFEAAYHWFKRAYQNNLTVPAEFFRALQHDLKNPGQSTETVVRQIMERSDFRKKTGIFYLTRKVIRKVHEMLLQNYTSLRKKLV